MVNVLVVADEVASNLQARTLQELAPDLVLAAGDLPWDYLEWIASSVDVPMVFVPGNHDPEIKPTRGGRFGDYLEPGALCEAPRPHGVINADQDVVAGRGTAHRRPRRLRALQRGPAPVHPASVRRSRPPAACARRAPAGPVDVLLTHAPPLGLGDADDAPHVGIEALHGVIAKLEPTWHLHGHIHPYGQTMPDRQVGPTTIRNVIPWKVFDVTPRASRVAARPA